MLQRHTCSWNPPWERQFEEHHRWYVIWLLFYPTKFICDIGVDGAVTLIDFDKAYCLDTACVKGVPTCTLKALDTEMRAIMYLLNYKGAREKERSQQRVVPRARRSTIRLGQNVRLSVCCKLLLLTFCCVSGRFHEEENHGQMGRGYRDGRAFRLL